MSKICFFAIIFCAIVALSRERECYYLINQMKCQYQCCGEEGSMRCLDSCDNVDCSSDEDCGDSGCCSKGKCNDPKSNCDSSQISYMPCSEDCPTECCIYEVGQCQTGLGCFPWNSNCSFNDACASSCCHEEKCRSSDFCTSNDGDDEPNQPIREEHDEQSRSETHISWKTPVIVIVIVIVVVVKVAVLVSWFVRRSRARVVVVRTVLAPTSTIQVNQSHVSVSDTTPFLSQDEEQIKKEQAARQHTA